MISSNHFNLLLAPCFLLIFSFGLKAQESYQFDNEVVLEMTEEGGETDGESSIIRFFSSNNHEHLGYEMQINSHGMSMNAKIINDMDANTMTTLIDRDGMKMAIRNDVESRNKVTEAQGVELLDEEMKPVSFESTGNAKTILGYKCKEYEVISEDENVYTLVWMSDEVEMVSFLKGFSRMKGMSETWAMDMPQGFPMEMITWPNGKESRKKMTIRVTEINKDKSTTISTKGYSIMMN